MFVKTMQIMLAALTFAVVASVTQADHHAGKTTIVDVAKEAGDFGTLLAALDAADLTATLRGPGPFTVFAPTDEAFAALPPGTLDGLLNDPEALAAILTYHVVSGRHTAADVAGLTEVDTLNGRALAISAGETVMAGNARVIGADVDASNGVIHVVDAVLIP